MVLAIVCVLLLVGAVAVALYTGCRALDRDLKEEARRMAELLGDHDAKPQRVAAELWERPADSFSDERDDKAKRYRQAIKKAQREQRQTADQRALTEPP